MTIDDLMTCASSIERLRNIDEWLAALSQGPTHIVVCLPGLMGDDSEEIDAEYSGPLQDALVAYLQSFRAELVAELTAAGVTLDTAPGAPVAASAEGV